MRQQQRDAGLKPPCTATSSNSTSNYNSVAEENAGRNDAVTGLLQVMRQMLPVLLKRFAKIADPRNPKKLKHRLTVLMIYGLLVFVFQYSSRRAANREITRPMFEQNLRALFPELDNLPHADTLFRLLCRIDVSQIEQAHIELINRLIRNKKFTRYLINNCYPIGIDGTQKIAFSTLWDEHLLQRKSGAKVDPDSELEQDYQYYVYVLEASLCFRNGMVIPLLSEFLEYQQGDGEQSKQDCESKAFHRLAARIKQAFPRLPIMLLLNVHTRCNLGARYRWGIEGAFLVEKHDVHGCTNAAMAGCQRAAQGYSYEHAFAKNWNAMKGYHYLMRLGHLINTLARFSKELAKLFGELGVQATIKFIRNTLSGPWLHLHELELRISQPFRLRLL